MFSLSPKLVPVPKQRTQEFYSLQVIGADHAGPIYYRSKNKAISKSYISLFSCIRSYSLRISAKSYNQRDYQVYEKANNKTAKS